jgi:pentatricopeptide repeat protein
MLKEENIQPNQWTFTALLTACSHSNRPDDALHYLNFMQEQFNMKPNDFHYTSCLDALARAGRFQEAEEMLNKLSNPSIVDFFPLLGAYRSERKPTDAQRIFDEIQKRFQSNSDPKIQAELLNASFISQFLFTCE